MQKDQRSPQSESSPDSSFDKSIDKSQLFAKLEEMSRAIDGYKEYKTTGQKTNSFTISTLSRNNLSQMSSTKAINEVNKQLTNRPSLLQQNNQNQNLQPQINDSFSCSLPQQKQAQSPKKEEQQKEKIDPPKLDLLPLAKFCDEEIREDETERNKQSLIIQVQDPYHRQIINGSALSPRDSDKNNETMNFNQTMQFNAYNTITSQEFKQYLGPQSTSPQFINSMSQQTLVEAVETLTKTVLKPVLLEQEIQCELDYQQQSEFIEKHKIQLQHFEDSLVLLKDQLLLQQENEFTLRQQMDSMHEEIQILRSEKQQNLQKEEDLLQQVDQLVRVVEEQTSELRLRDRQIRELNEIEDKCSQMEQDISRLMMMQEELIGERDTIEREKSDALKQVSELQDKLASEFSKKRKIKQDYEDQVINLNEELQYYQVKYEEMKELLNNCTDQLKEFDELNLLRNDVIEKLEKENSQYRQSIQILQQQLDQINNHPRIMQGDESSVIYPHNAYSISQQYQQTPGKSEKSFSLNLQAVNCERSRQMSRDLSQISEKQESVCSANDHHQALIDQQLSMNQAYLSERKPQILKRKNLILQDQFFSQNMQIQSERTTPKGQMIIVESERELQTERLSRNHDVDSKRLQPTQSTESISALNHQASIQQYERLLKKRQKGNHQTCTNFLSPEGKFDMGKLSINENIMTPQINSGNLTSVGSQAYGIDYPQSESKYQYGRYARDNHIYYQQVNKENSFLFENKVEKQNHKISQGLENNNTQMDLTYSQEDHSVISHNIRPSSNNGRVFKVLSQNISQSEYKAKNNTYLSHNSAEDPNLTKLDMLLQPKDEYDTQIGSIQKKAPFEYNNPVFKTRQDTYDKGTKLYQAGCTFAKHNTNDSTFVPNESIGGDDFNLYTVDHTNSTMIAPTNQSPQQPIQIQHQSRSVSSQKSSIRDEIKKLHNNINNLRLKMNIPTKLTRISHQRSNGNQTIASSSNTSSMTTPNKHNSPESQSKTYQCLTQEALE